MGLLMGAAAILGLAHKADSSKTVQAAIKGLDHLKLTDEEKVEYALKFHKQMQDESSIQSVGRRVLAFGIIGVFLLLVLTCVYGWLWNEKFAAHVLKVIEGPMSQPTTAVVICYFGYYGVKKIVEEFRKGK